MPGLEERAGLRGRHAVVIGGAFGLGQAVTLALAQAGVELAICDEDNDALPGTVSSAEATGVSVFSQCFNALDVTALNAFYATVGERLGHVDIVVNVVGGANMGIPFDRTLPEDWADDIHRNFSYVVHSTRAALPLLRKSGRGGSIINFTTIEAHRGAATISVYAGAKAATTNFSRALANELGHERIRINTIAPDMTPSRGNNRATARAGMASMADYAPDAIARSVAIACPAGTAPSPDDIANGVLFLASDLSAGVTGSVLHVDGGTFASSGFLHWGEHRFSPVPPPIDSGYAGNFK